MSLLLLFNQAAPAAFPVQYPGLVVDYGGTTYDLCLVGETFYAIGMGGAPMFYHPVLLDWYAVYLVEESDPLASPVSIETPAGTKAIRLRT